MYYDIISLMEDFNTNIKSKTLNERIEDLVGELEKLSKIADKRFSYKAALIRGVAQGLGIIIGSTVVAGILYAMLTKFISPKLIRDITIQKALEK